jgi:hypothetical protein
MADYDNTAPTASGVPFAWAPVRVVITTDTDLQGIEPTDVADDITLAEGNRILLAGQTTAADNGIYLLGAQGVTRATDADSAAEFSAGKFVRVTSGTVGAGTIWALTTTAAITLGSTALTFSRGVPSATAHNIAAHDNTLPGLSFPPTQDGQAYVDTAPSATGHGIADFSNTAPSATVVP